MSEPLGPMTEIPPSPRFLLMTRSALALFLTAVAVYGTYWLYLGRNSLRPPDNHFLELGRALVALELGPQDRINAVPGMIRGPGECSFWTFEAVRTRCRGVGIAVRNFEESERGKIVALATKVGEKLARPCAHMHVLPSDKRALVTSQLGCGARSLTFTLRVQAFSGEFIQSPSGGGTYRNEHIYTYRQQGVI